MASSSIFMSLLLVVVLISASSSICNAQKLSSSTFYDKTCPNALPTIRAAIKAAVSKERRMAASLLRLHFHDCFVQGCDGSVLLKDGPTIKTENMTRHNKNLRGFEVIDDAKARVEKICPGVVSCADILAVAARDASAEVGGPWWEVELGRRDSTTTAPSLALTHLPGPADPLDKLLSLFQSKGLNARDMVALSGSHTIGEARCATFRGRIYSSNTSDIDAGFANTLRRGCPQSGGESNLAPLDLVTPNSFDNNYFKNLIQKKGLLVTDQVLTSAPTDSIVTEYSKNPTSFSADFAKGMIKMGSIQPLTGSQGEIRKICSLVN